jgi:uncharacterized coiled-coil protein SlyX
MQEEFSRAISEKESEIEQKKEQITSLFQRIEEESQKSNRIEKERD